MLVLVSACERDSATATAQGQQSQQGASVTTSSSVRPRVPELEAAPGTTSVPDAEPDPSKAPQARPAQPGTPSLHPQPDANVATPDPTHGRVESGDSLSRILARAGLDGPQIHRVSTAMAPLMDPASIRAGQRYDAELDETGALRTFSFHRTVTEVVRVRVAADGTYSAERTELETEVRAEEIGGTVDTSLWAALSDRGHSPALVDVIVDTFAYDIDFNTATRNGDTFRIVVQRHELDGELVRFGRVLAAEYANASGTHVVLWWQPPGKRKGRYVDAEGLGVARTLLKTPLKYARISSKFDPKRMHPVLHRQKSHNGVDYAAPEGAPIWAAADGKIVHRKLAGGAGNMVILRHDGGLRTLYMHMSKFADGQRVGDKVQAKTVIGYVGSTGLATGPHLHFGMKKNGRYVDPTTVESVRRTGVLKRDRSKFAKHAARWTTRLAGIAIE